MYRENLLLMKVKYIEKQLNILYSLHLKSWKNIILIIFHLHIKESGTVIPRVGQ